MIEGVVKGIITGDAALDDLQFSNGVCGLAPSKAAPPNLTTRPATTATTPATTLRKIYMILIDCVYHPIQIMCIPVDCWIYWFMLGCVMKVKFTQCRNEFWAGYAFQILVPDSTIIITYLAIFSIYFRFVSRAFRLCRSFYTHTPTCELQDWSSV